ncbi:MAG TPA: 2-amino-4-hydroxy-6-hydroxymethyldihydropteridine diphosphokinase [Mycobacteriales bacterium]|nr:2-amino-4-hydroxy-6-hydroxymethyldihydropteridine diphosphokinase [Mycobacteriales bacterium]
MTAVLSLGSNLGDRLARLRRGLEVLAQHCAVLDVSSVYETAPIGVADQPAFYNLVARLDTSVPEVALTAAQDAEISQGRLRSQRWGPRSLDVDVIDVDGRLSADPRLTLPHPRAHERAFVLVPWLEVDATAVVVGRGPVRRLLAGLDLQEVRKAAGPPR